jgi:hypothetical protein
LGNKHTRPTYKQGDNLNSLYFYIFIGILRGILITKGQINGDFFQERSSHTNNAEKSHNIQNLAGNKTPENRIPDTNLFKEFESLDAAIIDSKMIQFF